MLYSTSPIMARMVPLVSVFSRILARRRLSAARRSSILTLSLAGHGSGAPMIEAMTRCAMSMVKKMQTECIAKMEVSPKAVADFNEHAALYLQRTAWAGQVSFSNFFNLLVRT